MNENNTNSFQPNWFGNIWQQFDALKQYKEQAKQNISNQNINTGFDNIKSLYDTSLTATDPNTVKQAKNATKFSEAMMAWREEAAKHWKDWSNATDKNVYAELKNMYPDIYDKLKAYTTDDAMDVTGFKVSMWWLKEADIANEDQAPDYDYQGNFLTEWFRPIINTSAALATKLDNRANAKWGYEINDKTMAKLEGQGISPFVAQNWWAFSQYLYEKYGRALTLDQQIKDEEMQYVSKHPELLDRFINNAETNLAIWEWALDTAFSITAPWIKTLLMWVWETNVWWALLNVAWEFLELWWSLINKLPLLRDRKENLSEEDQDRFDAFVWNTAAYLIAKWKAKKWELKLEKSLSPRNIIRNFDRLVEKTRNANITDIMNDVKWNIKSMVIDWKATPEKVNETAWKIVKGRNLKDQTKASNTLSKVDTEWVKTYSELSERVQKAMDDNMLKQSDIYKQDTTTYKPEQTRSTVDVENAWRTTTKTLSPVEDAINLLKEMYEWDPIQEAWLENLIKKFNEEWLTREEINNLSKAISNKSNSYNAKNELKRTKSAQDVERIRQAVKDFARQWSEELKNLDKDYSDMANTKTLVDNMADEVLKAKENLANKNILQKVWWLAWEILDFVWGKNFIQKILPRLLWDEKMSAITRERQLQNNLNKLNRLTNRLKNAATDVEVADAVEEFNNSMALPE